MPARKPPRASTCSSQANRQRGQDGDGRQGDQLFLRGACGDAHDMGIVRLDRAFHDPRDAELAAHFFHHLAGRAADGADGKRAEQPGQRPAQQQADETPSYPATLIPVITGSAELRLDPAYICDERSEQADRGNHSGGDGNALGNGFGGVAHGIQVGHDLAGFKSIFILHIVPGHLADAIGVIRDRPVEVHGHIVAGVAEHADADHGHRIQARTCCPALL